MPTPIPEGEKTAFLAVINVWNPTEVVWLTANMNNYEDIPIAIHRYVDYYGSYPNFLTTAMNCFTNATMLGVGIYYNQVIGAGPTNDPLLIINSTFVGGVDITVANDYLDILSNSTIDLLSINGVSFGTLNIASGSVVNQLQATSDGGSINNVFIKNLRNNPGTLNTLFTGSVIGLIAIDDGATYGNTGEVSVESTCATPASLLTSSNITTTSITLNWIAPISWLYMNLSYRVTGTDNWIAVDNIIGQFQGDTGYIFTKLLPGQYYDFQVVVVCVNGGYSTPIQITVQTTLA